MTNAELKNEGQKQLEKELRIKADEAFEVYLHNIGVERKYVRQSVPDLIAGEQADMGIDEFFDDKPDTNEDNLHENSVDYVQENYDTKFLTNQIEQKENEDDIRVLMEDDLCLFITKTDPYGNVTNKSYWLKKANQVSNLGELQKYISTDGVETFVEKYAPDWQEQLSNE